MKLFKILGVTLAAALFLAGCGGSGSGPLTGGGSSSGGGGGTTVASLVLTASTATIAADGSTTSTITAIARDANNAFVTGAVVAFSASAGGLQVVSATTDASGSATATLSAAGAAAGTTITVTAATSGVSKQTTVTVVAIQQSLSLTTSAPQIASDGSNSATILALLRDANNVALPGVTVGFGASSGVLTVTQAMTDSTGTAKATVTAGTDPTNRTITVTGTAGSAAPATVPVNVTGTALALTGPSNLVQGSQGTYQVLLTNSSGRGISGAAVTISSVNGNTVAPAALTTDANGQGSITVTAASIANSGKDTLSATSLGLIASRPLTVSSQNFSITTPATANTKVNLGVNQTVTATWLSGGAPIAVGSTVNFSATRGTLSAASALTDASGNASVTISSTTAGPAVVNASGAGVSAQANLDFVATNPTQIAVQASPAAVAVQATSTITATVRDPQNNLVEGATVTFSLNDSTGGQLSVASATSDAQGRAQTTYTAGNTTSAANGVVVTASVQGTAVSGTVTLSVGGQTVFLSLGTGNTINSPDQATYSITYAVLALDAQGAGVQNVPVTLRVLPLSYGKGARTWSTVASTWLTVPSTLKTDPDASPPNTFSCANEDTDYTGNIASQDPTGALGTCMNLVTNASIPAHKKDYNCNGILDPGNVAAVSPSSGLTDSNGELLVTISYPKDHAYYVTVQLVATTSVAGTQSSTAATFALPGAAIDFNSQTTAPPGPVSPYGQASTCANPL